MVSKKVAEVYGYAQVEKLKQQSLEQFVVRRVIYPKLEVVVRLVLIGKSNMII